jgi:molybdopterin synthase catalytic subunit
MRTEFEITEVPLDVARVVGSVADTAAGAIAVFAGTTRKSFEGKAVRHLEYEAYAPLAERTLEEIGTEIARKWPQTIGLAIAHRLGTVDVCRCGRRKSSWMVGFGRRTLNGNTSEEVSPRDQGQLPGASNP